MATIRLYRDGDSSSKFYIDLTYSVDGNVLTVTNVIGYRTDGYADIYINNQNLNHALSFPGGNGSLSTYWGNSGGCGWSSSGYNWNINGSQNFITSGGTGKISLVADNIFTSTQVSGKTFSSVADVEISVYDFSLPIPKVRLYNGYHTNVNAYLDTTTDYSGYSVAIGYRSYSNGALGTVAWLPSEIFRGDYDKQIINLAPGTTYLFMGWAQATDGSTESPYSDDCWTEANCTKFIAGAPYIVNYNDVYESTETTISITFSDIYNNPSLSDITGSCIGYREKGSSEIIWSPANWDDYAYAGTLYLSQTFTDLKPDTEYEFISWAYSSTNNGASTTYDDRDSWIVVKTQSTIAPINISINGNSFVTAHAYISVNGSEFMKINKNAFKVIN